MKKNVLYVLIGLVFLVFPASVFAGGKREVPQCDVTLINKTGAAVRQIIINESGSSGGKTYYMVMEKNASTEIKLKNGVTYDIVLLDTKGHKYGIKECKPEGKTAKIEVKSTDFIPQGILDVIKKTLYL